MFLTKCPHRLGKLQKSGLKWVQLLDDFALVLTHALLQAILVIGCHLARRMWQGFEITNAEFMLKQANFFNQAEPIITMFQIN